MLTNDESIIASERIAFHDYQSNTRVTRKWGAIRPAYTHALERATSREGSAQAKKGTAREVRTPEGFRHRKTCIEHFRKIARRIVARVTPRIDTGRSCPQTETEAEPSVIAESEVCDYFAVGRRKRSKTIRKGENLISVRSRVRAGWARAGGIGSLRKYE